MGLFSSLVKAIFTSNGASTSARTPSTEGMSDPAAMSARNGRHPAARVIDIDGDTEKVIYTYLGAVFKGVKKGAVFYVAPLGFDTVIHSKSTGTTTDSGAFGDTPLAYKGRTFGLTPSCLGFLKEMVAAGFKVQVKVKKIGMYSAGIPELVTMTADPQLLKQWWERQKITTEPVPFSEENELHIKEERYRARISEIRQNRTGIELHETSSEVWIDVTESNWIAGTPPIGDLRFTPNFEIIPTPKGSSAKPHIRILAGKEPLVEINASSHKVYKQLTEYKERQCRACYMYDYFQDSSNATKLYLVFD